MNIALLENLKLLGLRVQDRVTGLEGVCTSVTFDLYGCIQAIINPGIGEDGKLREQQWFDVNRLRVASDEPVMKCPHLVETAPAASAREQGHAERPRTMNKA